MRLHPLVLANLARVLKQEEGQGKTNASGIRINGSVAAFDDLTLLERRAGRANQLSSLPGDKLQAGVDYALILDEMLANRLALLERWLDRESYLLAEERWWPKQLPACSTSSSSIGEWKQANC